ncbi:hypothetical protein IC582_021030 [Cucumis melo]|uniref:Photosynthetic NDH subunit of lumenal location 1, chloroplastic isoform X1 n=2 Tax=Cucumis melo TaxID=3656 RepID=A0A1S3CKZ3_CUCME|nr:photosynthetic NDH subunit of lumenal location 1, chloroplastic isoform X1 [Cucumis melo]
MAVSTSCLSWVPTTASNWKLKLLPFNEPTTATSSFSSSSTINCSIERTSRDEGIYNRRPLLLGVGALATSLLGASPLFAQEVPKNYRAFVDYTDGYSYYYPSDWREFDFRAHDSAFKDRYLQLQNVRVKFIPTEKKDIHEEGPLDEVVNFLVKHRYAAPNQKVTIYDMKERTIDGKNYYTFEYKLSSRAFSRTAFATIAIANGRYYTLVVGANDRRWRRYRDMLKVVADSFRVLDI